MPDQITAYRIFIASPGGLQDERKTFRETIEGYNHAEAIHRRVLFIPVGWEDTLGGVGRPQSLINDDVRRCDYFVLILWDRWGTPPDVDGKFTSGTEEEFHVAMECLQDSNFPMSQSLVFFKSVDPKQLSDPGQQLSRVLKFRQGLESEKQHLFHTFDTPLTFEKLLTRHLGVWMRAHEQSTNLESVLLPNLFSGTDVAYQRTELLQESSSQEIHQAWALAKNGNRTQAESLFAQAIVRGLDPRAFLEFGRFLLQDGRVDQAIVMIEKARVLAEEHNDQECMADATRALGDATHILGDLAGAEEYFRVALALDQSLDRPEGIASDYSRLGQMLFNHGDLTSAEDMFLDSLAINVKLNNLEGVAREYQWVGHIRAHRNDVPGAVLMFTKSLELCQQLGLLPEAAQAYAQLGYMSRMQGEMQRAEEMCLEATKINERLGFAIDTAYNYSDLGEILATRGDRNGAEDLHKKALQIFVRLGWNLQAALQYRNLAQLLLNNKDFSGAEMMYSNALEQIEYGESFEEIGVIHIDLADVIREQGDSDRARAHEQKAQEAFSRLGKPPESTRAREWLQGSNS